MPKREDERWAGETNNLRYCYKHKRYYNQIFGCEACRLERVTARWQEQEPPKLFVCPKCKQKSLFWNYSTKLYECLNKKCKKVYTQLEFSPKGQEEEEAKPRVDREPIADELRKCPDCGQGMLRWNPSVQRYECLNINCRSTFTEVKDKSTTLSNSGATRAIGSIQKSLWAFLLSANYRIRRVVKNSYFRAVRKIRRNFTDFRRSGVLLVIIGLLIIFISIGYYPSMFGESRFARWMELPVEVFGGLILLIGIVKSSHRSRMKAVRTLIILMILFTGCSYAYHYLDESGKIDAWLGRTTEEGTIGGEITDRIPTLVDTIRGLKLETIEPTPASPQLKPTPTSPSTNESRVWIGNAYLIGADGKPIIIVNNKNAKNPSWSQLTSFLSQDPTDKQKYDYNSFVCADFAEMLHNNAEKAGWRAAYVSIELGPSSYLSGGGHALNAFETTDRGLVYIDCTAPIVSHGSADKVVDVIEGRDYIPVSIFPEPGWQSTWESMGRVLDIEVVQW